MSSMIDITISVPSVWSFTNKGHTVDVDLSTMDPEAVAASIARLAGYGSRMCNDTVNSAANAANEAGDDTFTREDALAAWCTRFRNGTLGTRTGGGRTADPETKYRRDWARKAIATRTGNSIAAVTKATKGARTFEDVVRAAFDADSADAAIAALAPMCDEAWAAENAANEKLAGLALNLS